MLIIIYRFHTSKYTFTFSILILCFRLNLVYFMYQSMTYKKRTFQYEDIARDLRRRIGAGEFQNRGRLPSERDLCSLYEVQRNTIRQALANLEKDGYIWTDAKRGSFIKPHERQIEKTTFLAYIHGDPNPALTHLMEGLVEVANKAKFNVRRINTDPPVGAVVDRLPDDEHLPANAAGIILWPQNPTDSETLKRLNRKLPLVLVDRRVLGVSADCVRFDDVSGGRMVTEHLLQQGYDRIAFLTDDVFAETVQHRWRGYVLALEAAHGKVDPSLSLGFHGLHEPFFSGAIRSLLTSNKDGRLAVFCSNDLVAFTLLRFLRDEGVRVPQDVAVAGYGNLMPGYLNAMSLTSVEQPFHRLGQVAANILLERVNEDTNQRLHEPHDVIIPVKLVVRSSSLGVSLSK